MVLNGKEWAINPDHKITYTNGKFKISDLDLVKDDESLSISTNGKSLSQDVLSAFSFDFKNFQLNEVSQLLEVEDAFYTGSVNGNFTLRNTANKMNYLADLTLTDLTLGNERIGNLVIKSQQRSSDLSGYPDQIGWRHKRSRYSWHLQPIEQHHRPAGGD